MTYKALTQLVNVISKLGKPLLESTPCFPVVHANVKIEMGPQLRDQLKTLILEKEMSLKLEDTFLPLLTIHTCFPH